MRLARVLAAVVLSAAAVIGAGQAKAGNPVDEIVKRGELRVAVQTQGPPVSFVNKAGKRTGLAVEIVERMAKDLNVKLVLQDYDWKGLIPALLSGKVDMIAADMTPTAQRTVQLLFSKPFFFQDTVAYTLADRPTKTWQDLNKEGQNVGAVQGGTYATAVKEFLPKATLKEFSGGGAAIAQAVSAGRLDGALTDTGNGNGYVREFKNLKMLEGVITREPLGFAMRAEDTHLKFWVDNYFELISANKQLDKMLEYWWHTTKWVDDHK